MLNTFLGMIGCGILFAIAYALLQTFVNLL